MKITISFVFFSSCIKEYVYETRKAWNGWFVTKNLSGCREKYLQYYRKLLASFSRHPYKNLSPPPLVVGPTSKIFFCVCSLTFKQEFEGLTVTPHCNFKFKTSSHVFYFSIKSWRSERCTLSSSIAKIVVSNSTYNQRKIMSINS